MWSLITNLLGGNIVSKVIGVIPAIFGNREKRDTQAADFDTAVANAFAAENAQKRENRTAFDSFVDGLNRLPRPLGFFAVMAILAWPVYDAISFSVAMQAYALVPAWIAGLIITVITFYYGGRLLVKDFGMGAPSAKKVREVLESQEAILAMRQSSQENHVETSHYRNGNTSKPLSLPAIESWNRLHNPNYKD